MSTRSLLAFAAIATCSTLSFGAITLSPMTSFGGGDGWRAPSEVLAGDSTGAAYPYLGTGSLERGLDYNPVTGNLILVSRSTAGNGIRILNGTTGVDTGALNQGTGIISGGTFATNAVGVADDGAIYVGNLAANTNANGLKIYKWDNEGVAAPSTLVPATTITATGTTNPRLGDSLDVVGGGSSTRIAAGFSATNGYAVYDSTGALSAVTPIVGAQTGEYRLGITFVGADQVWGKQTGASAAAAPVRRTSYSGSTGTNIGTSTLLSGGEMAMDYLETSVLDASNTAVPLALLATLDANSSVVRIYNVNTPGSPALLASLTTTSGTLSANGNAAGNIAFGSVNGNAITLYAMSSNQGIQALTLTVPEPTTLTALAGLSALALRRRK